MEKFLVALVFIGSVVSAQVPTGSLVGYWPFDGNANDYSGNNNHGAVSGAALAPDRFGNPNMAYRFNGINSKITVPHNSSIDQNNGTDFTIAIWEKAYTGNLDRTILTKHVSGTWNGYNFIAGNTQNSGYCTAPKHVYFYVASGALQDACSNDSILSDSTWHFLAGVYKSSVNKLYFYVDGILQSDVGSVSGTIANSGNLSFGYNDDLNDGFFNGVLDGGRLYKRALTAAEIVQLYNEPNPLSGIFESPEEQNLLSVFPNPAKETFTVKVKRVTDNCSISIINVLGQQVYLDKISQNITTIDPDLEEGIYYLRMMNDNKESGVRKLIIK